MLAALAAACAAPEKVRFAYAAANADVTKRFAEPHHLVVAGRRWYLIAFDENRSDWRTFRIDRITEVHRTGARFPRRDLPDGADAATWLTRSLTARTGTIRAKVLLHEPIELAANHIRPHQGILESVDNHSCTLLTHPDAPEYVAYNIALLPIDYELLDPPQLVPYLRKLAERTTHGLHRFTAPTAD